MKQVCRAYCLECGKLLGESNPTEEAKKLSVEIAAPLSVFCETRSHNTGSDWNVNFRTEWVDAKEQEAAG